jgi:hypothetical protein
MYKNVEELRSFLSDSLNLSFKMWVYMKRELYIDKQYKKKKKVIFSFDE